jgi:hypothetical protein
MRVASKRHHVGASLAAAWLAVTVLACGSPGPSSPAPRPSASSGEVLGDCQAVELLISARQRIGSLETAVSAGASPATIVAAAEGILEPIKPVLYAYGSGERTDAQATAIRTAVWDLVEAAGFFERQQVPGASAPASGLGSAAWALDGLRRAAREVDEAARLVMAQAAPGQAPCP